MIVLVKGARVRSPVGWSASARIRMVGLCWNLNLGGPTSWGNLRIVVEAMVSDKDPFHAKDVYTFEFGQPGNRSIGALDGMYCCISPNWITPKFVAIGDTSASALLMRTGPSSLV